MPMTNQEIFDKVATHLFKQGAQSHDPDKGCLYRTDDGLSCAVGCLIDDDEYDVDLEHIGADGLIQKRDFKNFGKRNSNLLCSLQNTHDIGDNWRSTVAMRDELRYVAKKFRLDPSILDTLSFSDR